MASADSITVKVPGHEIGGNGRSKYVLYRVEATRGSESFVALSRYSNFIKLDEDVRKAYKGNHLASNIPQLPPKQAKFIVHSSAHCLVPFANVSLVGQPHGSRVH